MISSRDMGDGPLCPEADEAGRQKHGKTYTMSSGNLWCPVTQTIFAPAVHDGKTFIPGAVLREGQHAKAHEVVHSAQPIVGSTVDDPILAGEA